MAEEKVLYWPPNQNKNQNQNQKPSQNLNQNQNQVPDQNPPPNQNPPSPLNPFMPNAPLVPDKAPRRPQLNWSLFKPEYKGRAGEDAETHLLSMNDWMDTHEFLEHIKVQKFCLTLVAEARLWYKSLRPINATTGIITFDPYIYIQSLPLVLFRALAVND